MSTLYAISDDDDFRHAIDDVKDAANLHIMAERWVYTCSSSRRTDMLALSPIIVAAHVAAGS